MTSQPASKTPIGDACAKTLAAALDAHASEISKGFAREMFYDGAFAVAAILVKSVSAETQGESGQLAETLRLMLDEYERFVMEDGKPTTEEPIK